VGSASWAPAQQVSRDAAEARDIRRVVQDASRALQSGDAALFLHYFDRRKFAGYPTIESHVVALTTQSDVASSVQFGEIKPVEGGYRLRVDWLVQLSVKETPGPLETRREVVTMVAAEQKGRWKITSLDPVEFFRPQGSSDGPDH
jgi:hypothetical protein